MSSTIKESGTTLLEVLCVLTILGVISVLGIGYYSKAHIQTQANDIVDNVLMRVATAEGSAHSKNILAGKNKTAHKYGIHTPKTLCGKTMIQVGKIAKDDQPLTPSLCKSVVKRLTNQKGIQGIFSKDCDKIDAGNFESSCETLTSLLVEVGSVPTRPSAPPSESAPSSPSTPTCKVANSYDDCKADEFVKDGCCEPCPPFQTRNDSNVCETCWNVKAGECCNPTTDERLPIGPCEVCGADGTPQPDLTNPACALCPAGSILVEDSDKDGKFFPECQKNHYVKLNEGDDTKGCCLPCPAGKITNGPNAVGEAQCVAETVNCEDEKEIEDINGNCYPCAWVRYLKVEDPNKVSQQCTDWGDATRMEEDGLSVLICPKEAPLRDKDGECWSCDTIKQVDVAGKEEYCSVCNGTNETTHHLRDLSRKLNSPYEEIQKNATGEGSYCNFKCPEDKPLRDEYGRCYSCDDPEQSLNVLYDCEAICDGRDEGAHRKRVTAEPYSSYCAKLCPEDTPLMNDKGNCYSCDTEKNVNTGRRTDCEDVCDGSNQTSRKKRTRGGNYCALPCPAEKPLMNFWGECYSCDADPTDMRIAYMFHETAAAEAACGVCDGSNTTSHKKRQLVNKEYCMSVCPDEKPLLGTPTSWADEGDYCFDCDTPHNVYLGKDRKEECTELCPNRSLDDTQQYCVLPCPPEKPLRGADGICYACDDETPAIRLQGDRTTESMKAKRSVCDQCSNRYLNEDYCALHCPEDSPLAVYISVSTSTPTITNYNHCKRCDDSAQRLSVVLDNCETVCDGSDTTIHKKRRSPGGRYCMACPSDKPIIAGSSGYECHSCDEEDVIKCISSWNTCSDLVQCDGTNNTTRAKRVFGKNSYDGVGNYWDKDGSYSCLNRPLTDEQGYCQPCDFAAGIPDANYETLLLCPNERYISGNYSYACKGADWGASGLGNNEFQCIQCGGTLDKKNKECKR